MKESASASPSGSSSPAIEDAEQDMAGNTGKMLALLKQADEMQQMLQQLESLAASTPKVPASAVHRPVMPPPSPTTRAVDEEFDEEEEEGDDGGEEYDEGEDSDAEDLGIKFAFIVFSFLRKVGLRC